MGSVSGSTQPGEWWDEGWGGGDFSSGEGAGKGWKVVVISEDCSEL